MKFQIKIESILGGISSNFYRGDKEQFATSIGIDPDMSLNQASGDVKTSGILRPSSYAKFSSTNVSGFPMWLITNPKNELLYAYMSDGKFVSYSSSFGSETLVGTPTSGAGNGAAYYNNYIYLATPTDISRYGPISETPALTNTVWTGTTLGSQTALGNTTYPSLRSVSLPNHPMFVHVDNKLYVGDFSVAAEANRGRGLVHWIKTKRTTDEGDTNDGTTRSAIVLPFGYAPTCFASWGTDLAIGAIYLGGANTAGSLIAANNTLISGKAAIFLWDAVNVPSLPYRQITLVDPTISALYNLNGNLYVWSGNMNSGVRISVYDGGYGLKQLAFFEEGFTPPAGAVDGLGNRIAWGAFTTYPANSASVYGLGYKDANLPLSLHNIINSGATATSSAGMVTALKYAQHSSFINPKFIVGWGDGTNYGLDNEGTTSRNAWWRTLTYALGKPFRINKITIPLGTAIAANMTLIPVIRTDDDSSSTTLTTINSTNFTGSQRRIVLYPNVYGHNNFNLELQWSGSVILPVTLPILVEGETLLDATE